MNYHRSSDGLVELMVKECREQDILAQGIGIGVSIDYLIDNGKAPKEKKENTSGDIGFASAEVGSDGLTGAERAKMYGRIGGRKRAKNWYKNHGWDRTYEVYELYET